MIISWNITKRCNLKCLHCYRDAGKPSPDELTTAEGIVLLKDIAAAGFKTIVFSGGEPLMRKDVYKLIFAATRFGMRAVLGTNGTLLDDKIAMRLKIAGLSRAGISIDSLDPTIHDRFRKRNGAWRLSVDAMSACGKSLLDFQAHTTVTKMNYKEVDKITDFVELMGAKAHHVFFLVPSGRGRGIKDAALDRQEYVLTLKKVLAKQKSSALEMKCVCAPQFVPMAKRMNVPNRFNKGCLAGSSYCCVLPDGDVHPCPYMPLKAGNVREKSFKKIWNTSPILRELREPSYEGACAGCQDKTACGGCRARAFAFNGDYMGEDPYCLSSGVREAAIC